MAFNPDGEALFNPDEEALFLLVYMDACPIRSRSIKHPRGLSHSTPSVSCPCYCGISLP